MIMNENGNVFTWLEVSAQLVSKRDKEKKEIDVIKASNEKEGITKIVHYPSYEEVCVSYTLMDGMTKLEDKLIAETRLYATPGALECGYAQCIDWTGEAILNENIYKSIGLFTCARLKLAGSCVVISKNKAFKMQSFYQCIEASEKSTISFILGGFFCYQSAIYWLTSRHEQIAHFIHAGLIKKASLQFYPDKEKRKTPDYLIETHKGKWHVFESKGGGHASRWQRIEEAVKQLESVTHVVRKAGTPEKILTFVCTHASIDADKDITIDVVDPVPDRVQPLIINPDVCTLLTKLTLISLYDTLSAIQTSRKDEIEGMDEWVFVHAPEYDDVQFGIPKLYLALKTKLKLRLGIYLLVKEIIDVKLAKNIETDFVKKVEFKLSASIPSQYNLKKIIDWLKPLLNKKISDVNYHQFFLQLSEKLKLPDLTKDILEEENKLASALSEPIKKHLSTWGGLTRTAPLPGYDDPWATPKSKSSNRTKKPGM